LAEIALEEKLGRVIAISDVVAVVSRHVAAAHAKVLALSSQLAPLFATEESTAGC